MLESPSVVAEQTPVNRQAEHIDGDDLKQGVSKYRSIVIYITPPVLTPDNYSLLSCPGRSDNPLCEVNQSALFNQVCDA